MKIIFFIFCCMPLVNALAVTPTTVTVNDVIGEKVYIYNTLNQTMDFEIEGVYADNFTLQRNAFKIVEIPPQKEGGEIIVKEIYQEGFINAIAIPVRVQKISSKSTLQSMVLESISVFSLLVGLLFLGIFSWRRKRKNHVQSLSL